MEDRKAKVMQVAIKLFANRGYHETSMQEIADQAGVSKGLLYKYFESKETLLVDVFMENHENMVERAKHIAIDQLLTPKEKLKKTIEVEFEGILGNKNYFNLITKSLLLERNKHLQPMLQQVRAELLDWHREMLLKVYGEPIKPIIWDMVMVFQGILKEYVSFIIEGKKTLSSSEVATFIVSSMDAVIETRKDQQPVIQEQHMSHYIFAQEKQQGTTEEKLIQQLNNLKTTIAKKVDVTDGTYQVLKETIQLFEQELLEKYPRMYLLQSLYLFLQKQLGERNELNIIDKLLKQIRE